MRAVSLPTCVSPTFVGHGFTSSGGTGRGSALIVPPAMPTHAMPSGGGLPSPTFRVSSVQPSAFCPDAVITAVNTFGYVPQRQRLPETA